MLIQCAAKFMQKVVLKFQILLLVNASRCNIDTRILYSVLLILDTFRKHALVWPSDSSAQFNGAVILFPKIRKRDTVSNLVNLVASWWNLLKSLKYTNCSMVFVGIRFSTIETLQWGSIIMKYLRTVLP